MISNISFFSYDVTQAVMMFMSLLSITLYKRVICHYLISGHSHMMPDRVVSHIKKSFGTNDLYLPNEMIDKIKNVDTVRAEFIDHTDPLRQIFTGWEKVLKDQFILIPQLENGYTKNHFYEFADGQVSIRHTVGSEIKYVHNYILQGTQSTIKNRILKSIIGDATLQKATMNDIILTTHPLIEFPKSKISSLSEKYFSIPEDKLYYYPSISKEVEHSNPVTNANNRAIEAVNIIRKKRGIDSEINSKNSNTVNKSGRKKCVVPVTPFSQSILRFVKLTPPSLTLPENTGVVLLSPR